MRIGILSRAVLAAVFVLTGCEAMNGALFEPTPAPGAPGETAVKPAAPPARTESAAVGPLPRPGVKPRPAIPGVDPKTLVGKNQSEAQALLGPPAVVQNSPPATIWRYLADGCTLDVFFYMDLGTNSLRALAYDAKTADPVANEDAVAHCVGLVQVTNRARNR